MESPAPRASAPGSWFWSPPLGVYLLEFSRPLGGLVGSSRAFGRLKMWPSIEPSARLPRAATYHEEQPVEGEWKWKRLSGRILEIQTTYALQSILYYYTIVFNAF